ncbi:MAG: sugar transporter [Bacteroidetes bacterium]|nr:MAG: sugar transporter [Bacteroidota bacterium]
MLSLKFLGLSLLAVFLLHSCVPNKKIIYLQDTNNSTDTLYQVQPNDYRLQKGDLIGIDVKLATSNPALKELFAQSQNNRSMQAGVQGGGDIYYMTGFVVDDSGFVDVPVIGKVLVEGKNIFETDNAIQAAFDAYLDNVFITVRFGGLRYSVLGEVRKPGKFVVLQNRMTIFEALANAGDLTDIAKRQEVRVIRQYPQGTQIHTINLLDEKLISSPLYYVQPNDVIYVEPLKIRALGTGATGLQTLQAVVTAVSAITTTLALIRLLQ